MQPLASKMPELQGESYRIQQTVCADNRSHHNGVTAQESATEWGRDDGGNGGH